MSTAVSARNRIADEFVVTRKSTFGNAWRYELLDGVIIARDSPEPDHGAIHAGLIGAIGALAASLPPGCRPEIGSAAIPDAVLTLESVGLTIQLANIYRFVDLPDALSG